MKRVLYLIVAVSLLGWFLGSSVSLAGDAEEITTAVRAAQATDGAIADKNYIVNVWTSTGTADDAPAVRVFPAGSSVKCHITYYHTAEGDIVRYYVVANAAGSMKYFTAVGGSRPSGQISTYMNVEGLPPGTYFFTVALTTPSADNAMSPTPYWFIIE